MSEQGDINFTQELRQQGVRPAHLYRAKVVDNKDPEKIGRIRARVAELMDGLEDDEIPWAIPRFFHWHGAWEREQDGTCDGSGSFSVPAKGTLVFLVWQSKDVHTPTYQSYVVDKKTVMPATEKDYPETHVLWRFLDCSILKLNTKTHRLYLYNSGGVAVRIDGPTRISTKGNADIHVSGTVVGDLYGDATFNIRKSDLREREVCKCPEGDGTGTSYPDAGPGDLTVNIKQNTTVNTEGIVTINTKKDVYVNTEGNLNAVTKGDVKVWTKGVSHIYGDGDVFATSLKDVHVSAENIRIRATKELHVVANRMYFTAEDQIHWKTKKSVLETEESHFKSDDIQMGDNVTISGASITGFITVAGSVAPGRATPADPESAENAQKAVLASKATTGPRADGGRTGWFAITARIVPVERIESDEATEE